MDENANLYAPPKASLAEIREVAGALSRDGKTLVMAQSAAFPMRCVKCNAPTDAPAHPCKLAWVHPGFYGLFALVIFTPVLPAIIFVPMLAPFVIALAQRKTEIEIRLCERHFRRIAIGNAIFNGGIAILVPLCVYAFASMFNAPLPYRMSFTVAALVFGSVIPWGIAITLLRRTVSAGHISEAIIRIRGCGKPFLDSLPEYPRAAKPKPGATSKVP